ncbi:hypothetical protein Aasi_1626 [Candidatus Amoebophilus asiaticus 5a2]|uniref:F-box domain-containing protein n=2 Tax=Candidatus Amoebophilus asiaticus TaxID=281120 RepID=C3L4M1_AMOA5|nr:hypothetical protein Aasi_1626 [Candidatus Amoebophilus asiaticus 5a2]
MSLVLASCRTKLNSPAMKDSVEHDASKDIEETIELPDEVMLQVFSELSVKDILQASQVCKRW